MAISAPPRPGAASAAQSPARPVHRLSLVAVGRWLMAAGTLVAVAGAGLDAWRHLSDAGLVHHEAVVSFGNPAHALLVLGIAAGALGVFLALAGRALDRRRGLARIGPPAAVAVLIVAALAAAANSDLGRAHAEATAAGAASHAHGPAPAPASATPQDGHAAHDVTQPVDAATEHLLEAQLAQTRAAALRFPTVADALRGGFTLADPYSAGIGAHYMRYPQIDGVFDPAQPEMLLYGGEDPGSPLVGVMFYVDSIEAPEGFAGPYDAWHRHFEACVGPHGTRFEQDPEAVECHHHGQTGWMLHAWVAPGWESVQGAFSKQNSKLS
jgi:hypothetical protein